MSDFVTCAQTGSNVQPLALLPLIGEIDAWQIHRCQVTEAVITQHQPMKLLYHYEHLDKTVKAEKPLIGDLLTQFDHLMTRERFAQLIDVPIKAVAMPWQLKFSGKLVVFHTNPDIALRLHWTNTLKTFEPVYQLDLTTAITHSFTFWQWIGRVEVVNKNPRIRLTASNGQDNHWQLWASAQFELLPTELAGMIQQFLAAQSTVQGTWLAAMQDSAHSYAQAYLDANDQQIKTK